MENSCIRDCVEGILLKGIKVWQLQIPQDDVSNGVRLMEDDHELLRIGESLGVPADILNSLPTLFCERPGWLASDEARQALTLAAEQAQIYSLVSSVREALSKVELVLRREVDPERLGAVLATLAFLAMERFCPEAQRMCQELERSPGTEEAIARYAHAIAQGNWELAKEVHAQVMASEAGQIIDTMIHRQLRRAFTAMVVGDSGALARILADIFTEAIGRVKHADN